MTAAVLINAAAESSNVASRIKQCRSRLKQ